MYRTRIKICGITSLEDAQVCAYLGVDAIGFVFYENSPRFIQASIAKEIVRDIKPFVSCVGLFVDAKKDYIKNIIDQVPLDMLQFHGQESEEACALYNKPYIKAIRMREDINLSKEIAKYPLTNAILLDSYAKGISGGTGVIFNWDMVPKNITKPIILAGGLNSVNVKDAIKKIRPYAVDVSGGVEIEKGRKDPNKIKKFINEVINA